MPCNKERSSESRSNSHQSRLFPSRNGRFFPRPPHSACDRPLRRWTSGCSGPTRCRCGSSEKCAKMGGGRNGCVALSPSLTTLKGACALETPQTSSQGHLGAAWVWRGDLFSLFLYVCDAAPQNCELYKRGTRWRVWGQPGCTVRPYLKQWWGW